jgi:replicative DNA helicase
MPELEYNTTLESSVLKTPPFSNEAEQSVLGGLMLDNDAWLSVSEILTEKDFYLRQHQILFRAIQSLSEEGYPCDPITISEWLQKNNLLNEVGGGSYLGLLFGNTPSAANIMTYAGIVQNNSVLRNLIQAGVAITESALNTQGKTTTELLDNAEKLVFKINQINHNQNDTIVGIDSIMSETLDIIDNLCHSSTNGIIGIPTGFTDLDKKLLGLQKSDLIIIAGRPAMGKTAFAMNIAQHVAIKEQKSVVVFSMEMSKEQLAMRLISALTNIDLQSVRTGQLNEEQWVEVAKASSTISQSGLFIDDSPALKPSEIRARLRRLINKQGKKIGLIVIDYLQLMQSTTKKENRTNEVTEISRALKALAKEFDVPVIALSQLNRNLEQRTEKRPIMADLRESGSIEQDADIIAFIYRDEVYDKDSPDKGTAEIIISKHRNGAIGKVSLNFNDLCTRFENQINY